MHHTGCRSKRCLPLSCSDKSQQQALEPGRKFSDNEEDNRVSGDRPKIALTSTER
ncbi:hypothetical protein T03_3300 [Trichinella britovi]|uniref:Uncharacterized protein n=2 Tax=Trichinella TaxID=6333 RepID=A0A0V1CDN5_TRIBR|nr:hypothetical protein T05_8865 [Trichinella murrelli]KRX82969.1 hypothetical protein T06_10033 [Trichinella sp. T6]KRY47313.1 hypothetical protein T03_3300 [Trichinella britovi]